METHYIDNDYDSSETQLEIWKNQVQTLDKDKIKLVVELLEEDWCLHKKNDTRIAFQLAFTKFFKESDLDETGMPIRVDINTITEKKKREHKCLSELLNRVKCLGIVDEEFGTDLKVFSRINRLIEQVDDAYQIVFRNTRVLERINHPTALMENPNVDHSLCTTLDIGKVGELSPYQQSILAVLDDLYKKTIRRYKGNCCTQIQTPDGKKTRAWKQIMTVQEYVYSVAEKESVFVLWKNLTSRGSCFRDVINHLSYCNDMQFPEIVKNRHVWSFQNGVFVGRYTSIDSGKFESRFYPYESREFACLDPTIVSCKYFDLPFNDYKNISNWYDIPTPYFQSVLEYQKFEPEVCKWMYVMGGRLCFDVNDMDGWQIIPFLKGIARSGKSTIITKVFKKFYENDDVRTLSNNVEKKFGLSSIYDAFLFIAPEVKGDLALEQAEFQSLVSGEDVSIAVKHEKAKSIEWKTPGILGGNEVPNWRDNSGSVLRRLLPWNFAKQVKDADPLLDDKLDKELPAILLKCIKAYLDYSQKYRNKDIWNVVPQYFKEIQKQVAMVASTLHNFLASSVVIYGPGLFCPQKVFISAFSQHCHQNNLAKPKFNQDSYAGPFSSRDIEVRNETVTYQGRILPNQPIVYGLDILLETLDFSMDA